MTCIRADYLNVCLCEFNRPRCVFFFSFLFSFVVVVVVVVVVFIFLFVIAL